MTMAKANQHRGHHGRAEKGNSEKCSENRDEVDLVKKGSQGKNEPP